MNMPKNVQNILRSFRSERDKERHSGTKYGFVLTENENIICVWDMKMLFGYKIRKLCLRTT